MSLSHSQLRRWYRDANRKWFGGRLPAEMDVFYAPLERKCEEATHCTETEAKAIQVNTGVCCTSCARGALIHGMNHHDTDDWTHGAKFQAGMLRLANEGAFKTIW